MLGAGALARGMETVPCGEALIEQTSSIVQGRPLGLTQKGVAVLVERVLSLWSRPNVSGA